MSSIVIIAVGSRGDVAPLTGVGVALQRAGHDVAIAAYTPFAELIRNCGLGFRELPAQLEPTAEGAEVSPVRALAAFASPAGMRALGNDIIAAVADQPADMLLLSPFAELVGHPLAAAKGIPSLGVRLQPLSATAQYPPAVLGAWSAGALGNRLAANTGARLVDRLYGGVVAEFRRALGLPRASARRLRRHRSATQWPVLHGYSPLVVPRPPDWRPGLEVTGYWWPADAGAWAPPGALTDFLAAGPAPVFLGFGSMMTTAARAEQLSNTIRQAARRAGVRVIVQAGWSGLRVIDDDMVTIGEAPHDWLFPRVAAVAHHCGAGTTAAGLRAGVPAIGLPGYGDGPFWARRLQRLGVCAAAIAQRQLTAARLADAMRAAVTDPRLRHNARRLGSRIAAEDGAARVVAAVAALLGESA
ncbi:glycosyltransferase [Mycobacterium talmoniae]|uniref:Sterol 3-beta-glucosyltransferase n=1 Tax=Mycobacterium talmoniae TaxID=1858794 RepID=A0A1S1NFV5_9MYCO|nr:MULTISPECIES: glycosyltransferase [Mycobacterium]OHU99779.1 sterol 3-beta-glucosyltransferase [Mycobacterium talmoniae]TDH48670.1 glycosyltransferase [Mycobacterium eburneum]